MNSKRIFTAIIALVLVVCLLVNVSPVKAEASVMGVIAGATAIGIAATLILNSAGVVFLPQNQKHLEAVGQAFSTSLYQWGTSAEELDAIDDFLGGLTIYEGSGGDPDDDDDWQPRFDIPDLIKRGVALFTAGCIAASSLFPHDYSVDAPEVSEADINKDLIPLLDSFNLACSEAAQHSFAFFCIDNGSMTYSPHPVIAYSENSPITVSQNEDGWRTIQTEDGSNFMVFRKVWGTWQWSTEDVYSAYLASDITWFGSQNSIGAPYYVGDIPEKVQSGEYDESNLPLPETIYYGTLINPDLGAVQSVINLADDLATGKITFEEYKTLITTPPQTDPVPDPSEPGVTTPGIDFPAPDIDSGTLAETNPNTFLEKLGAYITSPFKWIWTKIETYFEPLTRPELWTETIPEIAMTPVRWIWEKIETFIAPLLDPDILARPFPEIIAAPFQNLWTRLEPKIDGLSQSISQAAQNAADQVTEAVNKTVVPEKDYLTDKVNALLKEFAFADSIVTTAKTIKLGLAGVTTEPPVIYIHLEDNRGSYDIGGTVPFLDLRWYAEYKPTVDALISAFLWICFAWKMLLKLPGIISGVPGDFVMDSVHHIGMSEHMPVRKAEYEVQRVSNRQYIRRGKDG